MVEIAAKDELESLYQAIFKRKSVRKYAGEPLAPEVLDTVLRTANETTALDEALPVKFRIVKGEQIKGIVPAKAPHYLAVYAKAGLESRINAAFKLQQMDLWLSAHGYGSCWLGMPNSSPEIANYDDLPFDILLAFGTPAEAAVRSDLSEFKRKPLGEIASLAGTQQEQDSLEPLLVALRLAPSASNRQPWKVSGNASTLRLNVKKDGFFGKMLYGQLRYTDAGIGLCHLWLAALHAGSFTGFEREIATPPTDTPQGYEYFYTVRL